MSHKKQHRLQPRAFKEAREDKTNRYARTAIRKAQQKRKYWVVNLMNNKRSAKPVTMERFLDWVGRNRAVATQFQLYEAK